MNEGIRSKQDNEEFMVLLEKRDDNERSAISSCLMGKFWANKSFNTRTFMSTIKGVWSLRKVVDINELGKKFVYLSVQIS